MAEALRRSLASLECQGVRPATVAYLGLPVALAAYTGNMS